MLVGLGEGMSRPFAGSGLGRPDQEWPGGGLGLGLHRRWSLLFGLAIAAATFGSAPAVSASASATHPSANPRAFAPLLHHPAAPTPSVSAGATPKPPVFTHLPSHRPPAPPSLPPPPAPHHP